ncbi:MAG: SIS domain-containing protein [Candidatus Pacebacteria bacterium]|nr:SIS domain-containing protein [Candidatus Paceibacterota bacterium]
MDNFKNSILNFNKQLTPSALQYFRMDKIKGSHPDAIIVIGMGGSGQAGFLASDLKYEVKIPVPVLVWENYGLPKTSYKKPLFIFVSFSGNTNETLSGFSKARLKAAVCSGGQLKKLSDKAGVPLSLLPAGNLTPRQANGLMFYGIMQIVKTVFPGSKNQSLAYLKPKSFETAGKIISRQLKNKTVLIYSSPENNHLSYIWKTNLNETAKSMCFSGTFPEMTHNEIVPLEKRPKNVIAVFLENNSTPQGKRKMGITTAIMKKNGVSSIRINLSGKNNLEKTWNSIILSQWVAYHLAEAKKINPVETKLIDQIKKLTA